MPKVKISEYSATANSNTDVASINIDEGCAPSGINNAIRAVMGHLKDFQQGTNGDPFNGPVNGTLGATTPNTASITTLTVGNINSTGVIDLNKTGASPAIGFRRSAAYESYITSVSGGGLEFQVGAGLLYKVNIDATGNVGIGTSSPAAKFEVSTGAGTKMRLTSTADNNADIDFYTNSVYRGIIEFNSVGGLIYTIPSLPLTFGTGNQERARIDSSGNLGLGVTPSANAGQKTLSIANQTGTFAALTMGSNFTQAGYIGYNMGNTGTNNTWRYIGADSGSALWFNGNEFRFMQFASGSAGATTSGTQAMTLDASGNLLVGTTSAGGGKVYVVGGASQSAILGTTSTLNYAGIQGAHTVNASNAYVAYFANSGSTTGLYISNTAAWQSTSDERLKTDIQDLDSKQRLMQLRPRDYLWKSQETSDDPTKRNLGFIAQEVKDIFPELVGVSPDGMFSVEYTGLIAPLVKAIQELKAEFDAYKASHP
jgi:hypothetical protein